MSNTPVTSPGLFRRLWTALLGRWLLPPVDTTEQDRKGMRLGPDELAYVDVVEAAMLRRPTLQARVLSIAVGLFFLLLLGWASVADLDEVTHAEGQVVSSQRTQSIQNLEGGILRAVLVHEGQIIEKGTPLARLDNEMAESNYRDAINKSKDHEAAIIRLTAELEGQEPVFPEELQREAPQVVEDQKATYQARMQQRVSELRVLESQYEQRVNDVEEQLSRKNALERSLAIAVEQRDTALPLMQRKTYSRMEFLGLEQRVVSLQGDIEALAASLPKSQSAAQEAKDRIAFRQAEFNSSVTEEINKRRMELASLKEALSAGSDRVTRTELKSPVRGTVKQIYLHTVGGVVKPGESIMDIVPLDDTLLIEAKVRPADVAFLHPDQSGMVKFSAYDFAVYGGLRATLETISADTIEDKKGETYYLVKLRTKENAISYRGKALPIIPGMMVTVDILTGHKTVLDYILKPILKARQNALRER